jgi:SAM-dependent methyltransferase
MPYCLPPTYHSRWPVAPLDVFAPWRVPSYQRDVYRLAAQYVARAEDDGVVLDYGCGSAKHALQELPKGRVIGVDLPAVVSRLALEHPTGLWLTPDAPVLSTLRPAVIVCADVIEHVEFPDQLLRSLLAMRPQYVVLSTPARDLLGPDRQAGPPANPHHAREWAQGEFVAFVSQYATIVESSLITPEHATYCVVCRPT